MHIRCPHCHNAIEIVEDSSLRDVECPSCGSHFNLASEAPTQSSPSKPRKLAHYELLEQVGVGHFGAVWKARDTTLDRFVALKIPRRDQIDKSDVESFFREARAAARLNHPNIVGVHEVGREGETIYIASDYVDGATLKEWLKGQPLPPVEAAKLCAIIADALHVAHESAVIHRDLKPQNIMMDMDGKPYIMDFGLAKRESGEITVTIEGIPIGTPAYMPPEQAAGKGHDADRRSDVYSLGVILFEMLTGDLPFRGETRMLMVQIQRDEAPSPRRLNGGIPRDLETISLKCLEKEPDKRYESAKSFSEDLQRFLHGEAIVARPVGRIERAWRWCKRNPVVSLLIAAFVVAVVAGIAGVATQWIRAEDEWARAEEEAEQRRRQQYVSDMIAASYAWEENEVDRTETLLWRHVPRGDQDDIRGFEWYYLWRLCQGTKGRDNLPQPDKPYTVAFSEVGKVLATGGEGGFLRVYDLSDDEPKPEPRTLSGHSGTVVSIAFSPDGTLLASAGQDGTIIIWQLADSTKQTVIPTGNKHEYQSVAFSPDGESLASCGGSDHSVRIWRVNTGQPVTTFSGHTRSVTSVAYSSDGKILATGGGDKTVRVWQVNTEQQVALLEGHKDVVRSVAIHGDLLASGSDDGTVKLWHVTDGEKATFRGHRDEVQSVAFSPDGTILASGSRDNTVKLWNVDSQTEYATLKGHSFGVESIAFSGDGTLLAAGDYEGSVKLWSLGKQQRSTIPLKSGGGKLVLFPKEETLAVLTQDLGDTAIGGTVELWSLEVEEPKLIDMDKAHTSVRDIARCGTNVLAVALPDQILRWDLRTGVWLKPIRLRVGTSVSKIAVSWDGQLLAVGGEDGWVTLYDVRSPASPYRFAAHKGTVNCLAFTWNGEALASGGADHEVKLWDVELSDSAAGSPNATSRGPGHKHEDEVMCVAFSPLDDRMILASGGLDRSIRLFDWTNSENRAELLGQHTKQVCSLLFLDGKTLVSAGGEGVIVLWDLTTHQQRFRFIQGRSIDEGLVFWEERNLFASRDRGGTVHFWRRATEQEVQESGWYDK